MKAAKYILLLFLPFMAAGQSSTERAIADITTELVLSDGIYYNVITVTYETGPPSITPVRIGNAAATLSYLQNTAVNRQQEIAASQKKVIEEKTLSIRQFQGIDTLVQQITGGDTTLFTLNNYTYFPDLAGQYRIRNSTGSTNFVVELYQLANGAVRFREVNNPTTTYPVLLYSPKNFRVLNLVIGALPAGPYDCYEVTPNANGQRVWRDDLRIVTITKL